MKIRPVILCGGEGTRLWPKSKNSQPKQFIDFGGWNLLEKTLDRIKDSIFDYPIISTNLKYLNIIKKYLKNKKIKKYKIILEPAKKNTAPAILVSTLIKDVPNKQPLVFFPADHLIEKVSIFNKIINRNKVYLNDDNVFIFGVKPTFPSNAYGYFLTKKIKNKNNKVIKFIEKPNVSKAKKIIKKKAYWNSGILFSSKISIINNFKKFEPAIYKNCVNAVLKAKLRQNTYYLYKPSYIKNSSKSFDYAILEKSKNIRAIKINIPWTDLGNWFEISKIYRNNKIEYFKKINVFYRPWGNYVNLFKGKNFLVKELTINSKSSISLQKHHHRSEYWTVTHGKPKITINNKSFFAQKNSSIFIPTGSIHRIENLYKVPIKIIEIQTGSIIKESDIVRYKDIYNRV